MTPLVAVAAVNFVELAASRRLLVVAAAFHKCSPVKPKCRPQKAVHIPTRWMLKKGAEAPMHQLKPPSVLAIAGVCPEAVPPA